MLFVCVSCGWDVLKRLNGSRFYWWLRHLRTRHIMSHRARSHPRRQGDGEVHWSRSRRPSPNHLGFLLFSLQYILKWCFGSLNIGECFCLRSLDNNIMRHNATTSDTELTPDCCLNTRHICPTVTYLSA